MVRFTSSQIGAPCPAVLPQRIWRQLLSPSNVPPCARVLVAGPQSIELAAWLAGLSFDVLVVCDDAATVLAGRRTAPQVDFVRLSAGLRFPLPPHSCDAAFVNPLSSHGENRLSLSARLVTAAIASGLKPAARVATWQRRSDEPGHGESCWPRHLACFPGRIETTAIFDSVLPRWGANSNLHVTTWRLPAEPLTLDDWRNYARRGLLTDRRECCAAAVEQKSALRHAA